jgi:hypothetical protein
LLKTYVKQAELDAEHYTGVLRRLQKGASLDELVEFLQLKDMRRVKRIAKKLREVEARPPWEGLSVVKKESRVRRVGSLERRLRRKWKRSKRQRGYGK